MSRARERLIQGDGTPGSVWQPWLHELAIAPLSPAALSLHARLVVVAPHPDDEILTCAGLMAHFAQTNRRVRILAVSEGEASHGKHASAAALRLLARRRHGERLRGLACLGISPEALTCMGLPDGEISRHAPRISAALASVLNPTDLVVSTWRLDGHPDHDSTGAATARSCSELGCTLLEAPVWMWNWSVPHDRKVPWQRLRRFALTPRARHLKKLALDAHASQMELRPGAREPVLGRAIIGRARWPDEYFFSNEGAACPPSLK